MNAVLAYSLALLLAGGGPATTGVTARKEAPPASLAGLPAPNAGATAKPATAQPAAGPTAAGRPAVAAPPATAVVPTKVAPATVAPNRATMPPEPRPAWVDEREGIRERGVYVMHVYVGPELSRTECESKLNREIERRLVEYGAEFLPGGAAVALPFEGDRLRSRIVTQEWEERIHGETADLVYLHVQLRIDEKLRQEWKAKSIEVMRAERNRIVMFGYAGAVAAAIGAFVLLKWSGRSSVGAGALLPAAKIVGIIVGGAALVWLFVGA